MSAFGHDAETLYTALVDGVTVLRRNAVRAQTRLVGIASGGVWLAERLQVDLRLPDAHGVISSAMHRDDFSTRGLSARVQTKLPFDVNGAHIVLLDDVLFTGRTIRAVLNELFDYGRPASVQLAVLVDRGGRELPIEAAFSSVHADISPEQKLTLTRSESGVLNFAIEG